MQILGRKSGHDLLIGPVPNPKDINIQTVQEEAGPFVKHVLNLFRKDRIMDGELCARRRRDLLMLCRSFKLSRILLRI